ncbi:MAG: carboxynorspermidine decarboxylase [Lachnospiraceae bacterium]|nr:carboxynorspermidine decarboxylase [Lachnospiraceae bacterium]
MQQLLQVPTPSYVIDEQKIEENCRVLRGVMERTGCKILLAQKAFSAFSQYPLIGNYLAGTTASGLFEARLGREEMNKENHVFSPAYRDSEFDEVVSLCDHIVFNSVAQLKKYLPRCSGTSVGLRVNPRCSTQGDHAIYDPCAPGSRLGVTRDRLTKADLEGVDGLHFHTLCEQNSDDLETTLAAFEEQFGEFLYDMKWVNFGGGHHITRADYDIEKLEACICHMKNTYNVEVYLEPGEAVALNAGYLTTEILDIVETDALPVLILDASAACHMPDVLEMPYRPPLRGSGQPGEKAYTYRLSSYTCLAGDIIGDYSFDSELHVGDRLVFEDMAIYSMVKNNTFNGIPLPSIYGMDADGECRLIKEFSYQDFKERLS